MTRKIRKWAYCFPLALLIAGNAAATSVPKLSFEELTDRSEMIVSGDVTRSWAEWDSEHKYIWTHYELSVSGVQKGAPGATVVLSEPGGEVGLQGMAIAGAVVYRPGDRVLVFLQRMPNGYLRTTGWSQGKYLVDGTGRLHAETSLRGPEVITAQKAAAAPASLRSLDGMAVTELGVRIAARLRMQRTAQQ